MTLVGSLFVSMLMLALLTLAGMGFGRLLGLGNHSLRLLLAPPVFVAALALMLVLCVLIGMPLHQVAPYIWGIVVVAATYGLFASRGVFAEKCSRHVALTALGTSMAVLGGFEWHGLFDYLGSPNQDGFTYVAFGEYLRHYPRGTEGGLAPLYQFGSHLSATRYVAAASLAVFIPPGSKMDTQMMVGPVLLMGTFAFATGIGYLACVVKGKGVALSPPLVVVLTVLGGWFPFVLLANNYDNLVVLSLAPVLYGLGLDGGLAGRSRWLVPAVLCASAIYIYPELSVLVIAGYYVAGLDRLLGPTRKPQILLWIAVAAATVVLIGPYLPEAVRFFQSQLALTTTVSGPRPGNGFMPDLLEPSRLPAAIWGIQHGASAVLNRVGIALGVVLAALMVVGGWTAVRARIFSVCVFMGVAIALLAVMIGIKRYDYGAYKILLFAWWAMALLVSMGLAALLRRPTGIKGMRASAVVALAVLCVALLAWGRQQLNWAQGFVHHDAAPLREARERMAAIGGPAAVMVADPILSAWMVYELRHLPMAYPMYSGYLAQAHVLPVMARSNAPVDGGMYALIGVTEPAQGQELWHNEKFRLVRRAEGEGVVTFGRMDAPNGVERVDGDTFIWLGQGPASIALRSTKSGTALLTLDAIGGTSVADSTVPLTVTIDVDAVQVADLDLYRGPGFTVPIPVRPGETQLGLRANYGGAIGANPNGDTRILLAGVKIRGLRFEE